MLLLAWGARVLRNALVVLALLVALDWVFRLPGGFRALESAAAIGGLAWFIHTGWRRYRSYRPSRVDLALRIERVVPSLRDRLTALIEFDQQPAAERTELLAAHLPSLRAEVDASLKAIDPSALVSYRPLVNPMRQLALVATLWAVGFLVVPSIAQVGVARVFLPWSDAQWPSVTEVIDRTARSVVGTGTSFAWKAELARGDASIDRVKVEARIKDHSWGAWQSGWLSMAEDGTLERMQDVPLAAREIEYRFVTTDSATPLRTIRCIPSLAVAGATLSIEPPGHLPHITTEPVDVSPTPKHGATAQQAVEGSMVRLSVTFSRAVAAPASVEAAIGEAASVAGVEFDAGPTMWTTAFVLEKDTTISIDASDPDGVRMLDPFVLRVIALPDKAPIAVLELPATDQTVLPSAKVPTKAQAEDDFGLTRSAIEAKRTGGTAGADITIAEDATHATRVELEGLVDIAAMEAGPGDVVLVTATAQDGFQKGDVAREPTRSVQRRLRVVSASEFNEEIAAATSALRQGVLRLRERQHAASEATERSTVVREQADLTTRAGSTARQLHALADRVRMNEDRDTSATRLLEEAASLLDESKGETSKAAEAATNALDGAWKSEELRAAQAAAEDLFDATARLLDRDTKSWEASQSLARAAEAIEQSQAERSALAGQVQGKSRDELTPGQKEALERIAQRDEDTARALRDAAEAIQAQAEAMQESDPAQAAAMEQAAARGQKEGVVGKVEQSAEQTRSNSTQQAQQSAKEALESIARMQEDLEAAQELEATVLKRITEDLEQRLTRLIEDVQAAMDGIDGLREGDPLPPPEPIAQVERLRRNTNDALEAAVRMERRLDNAIRAITPAIGHEEQALMRLAVLEQLDGRASVQEALVAGHDALRRALEAVQAAAREAQREEEQQARRKLAECCQALVGLESAIVKDASVLGEQADPRRRLIEGRRLALSQEEVGSGIAELMADEGVARSEIFGEALAQAGASSVRASGAFRDAANHTTAHEAAAETLDTLTGLAAALSDRAKERDRFAEARQEGNQSNQGGGGGGGADGGSILPIAELKLLRDLQARLSRRTTQAIEGGMDRTRVEGLKQTQERLEAMASRLRERIMQAASATPRITPSDQPDGPEPDHDAPSPEETP